MIAIIAVAVLMILVGLAARWAMAMWDPPGDEFGGLYEREQGSRRF